MTAYSGVLAERFERIRLMMTLDVTMGLLQVVMVVEMIAGAHPAVVVATAAVCATVGTIYPPAAAAMTPQLIGGGDLGAANALRNTVEEISVIAGPAIGGLLIIFWDPWAALLFNAATFAASAMCLRMIKARSTPVDVTDSGEVGPLRQMLVGIQTIGSSSATSTLVAFSARPEVMLGSSQMSGSTCA
jgi:predicted MFS family arabinose efflux permease